MQTAEANLRTAKIQLLARLNDRTPVEQFDVTGVFDFSAQIVPLDEMRQTGLDTRPDLKAAWQSVDKSKTDHRLRISGAICPLRARDEERGARREWVSELHLRSHGCSDLLGLRYPEGLALESYFPHIKSSQTLWS